MDVLVTGATGFVGANLVRALLADGRRVRVLVRRTSNLSALAGCPVEVVAGDILDQDSVTQAAMGCRLAFHVAADYRLWAPDPRVLYRNNVDGTRNVLEACAQAGVERVVYTSSVGTLGLPRDGRPGTETTSVSLRDMIGPYKRSKSLAERVAEEYAARDLGRSRQPVDPIGPWEVRPTPTGQIIVDFLEGRMSARWTPASTSSTWRTSRGGTSCRAERTRGREVHPRQPELLHWGTSSRRSRG